MARGAVARLAAGAPAELMALAAPAPVACRAPRARQPALAPPLCTVLAECSGLALVLLLAACEKADHGPLATREQCDRMHAEAVALADRVNARGPGAPEPGFRRMNVFGDWRPELCAERMTSKQVDCIIAKYRASELDTSTCKPEVDLRPADARRSSAECERYVAKSRELALAAPPRSGLTSAQLTEAVVQGATNECAGWLSRARYECVLAATTDDARRACPL